MPQPGRPRRHETKQRKARFLTLCAEGLDPLEAQQESGLPVHHAFELVADRATFDALVDGLRRTGGTVAVELSVNTEKAVA